MQIIFFRLLIKLGKSDMRCYYGIKMLFFFLGGQDPKDQIIIESIEQQVKTETTMRQNVEIQINISDFQPQKSLRDSYFKV